MERIERPCPLCGSTDQSNVRMEAQVDPSAHDAFTFASRKIPEPMHHRLVLCPGCDLLYASPAPTGDFLRAAYAEAAFDSGDEAAFAARTYARLLPSIERCLPDRRGALDIGTGDGAFLEHLVARGYREVVGIEPSRAPVEAAKPGIRPLIRCAMFDPADFRAGSFSLVTVFQTLEHLPDPMATCRSAFRMLKAGGAGFFVCHNHRAISARVLGARSPIVDIEHLQLFSPRSARRMMEAAGFSDVTVRPLVNRYPLSYWVKLLPFARSRKRGLVDLLKKIRIGDLPLPLPAGNMAVVGFRRAGRARLSGERSA